MSTAATPDIKITRQQAISQLTAAGEPYELVAGRLWGRECRVFKHAPKSLRELFEVNRSAATFIVYDEERFSF